jgi:hypothetical protein
MLHCFMGPVEYSPHGGQHRVGAMGLCGCTIKAGVRLAACDGWGYDYSWVCTLLFCCGVV